MKNVNIVKKLKKEGYSITFKKWAYWDDVPHVQCEGFEFAIAEIKGETCLSLNLDFIFNHVLEALDIAQRNNPIFLKKIKKAPNEDWYYSRYLIRDMGDYYQYKKDLYPFNGYYQVLKKLKNEVE